VREFVEKAARLCDMEIVWQGSGVEETGIDRRTGKIRVRVDPRYFRPTEVDSLLGDPAKARSKLGWSAEIGFDALVAEMVNEDRELARRDALVSKQGFKAYQPRE
jgi:GDPmannose 4,6-dehydratase